MRSTLQEQVGEALLSPIVMEAVAITRAYRQYAAAPMAIREAMCLKAQYPATMQDVRPGDLFAGRRPEARIVYVGPIWWLAFPGGRPGARSEGKQGGYCFEFNAVEKFARNDEEKRVLTELTEFWEKECTWSKISPVWDEEARVFACGDGQINGAGCGMTVALELDRLVQRGIPGLRADIQARQSQARQAGEDTSFFEGLALALDVLVDTCRYYEDRTRAQAAQATTSAERVRLETIADTVAAIAVRPPETFRQAVQLVWLYSLLAAGKHLEGPRLDVALGDLFARDIDCGVMTEEEGIEQICSLWRLFNENGEAAVCRVVVGGVGRRNEISANRFALAAMEATRRHRRVTPQLTLRFYKGQDAQLLEKAYEVLGAGCTFPMLYNDDVVVPGIVKALHVSHEDAPRYHPLGCGEYMVGGCNPSVLNYVWSIPKTLEAVLHNGKSADGTAIGIATGALESFDTFEKLYAAVQRQMAFTAGLAAKLYRYNMQELPKHLCYLFPSLLTDDCLARGKGFIEGARYRGVCIMGHGFSNAADSLTAIEKVVYREKRVTLQELVAALDANFEGYEALRKMLLECPKFGNDDEHADRMLVEMWRDINNAARQAGTAAGLGFLTVSSVNPGGYWAGASCGATADGRLKGENFAIGHAPTAGADKNGLTALFNSAAKIDADNGGATTNFKLSADWFNGTRSKAGTLFKTYFAKGGQEATITVVNREDLDAALTEPEKYPHVLVRLGGWSARFIDLDKRVQMEILQRTQY